MLKKKQRKPTPVKRHPQVIAWDEWAASEIGRRCLSLSGLTNIVFLDNRLRLAFIAGWKASLLNAGTQLMEAGKDY